MRALAIRRFSEEKMPKLFLVSSLSLALFSYVANDFRRGSSLAPLLLRSSIEAPPAGHDLKIALEFSNPISLSGASIELSEFGSLDRSVPLAAALDRTGTRLVIEPLRPLSRDGDSHVLTVNRVRGRSETSSTRYRLTVDNAHDVIF